MSKQERGYSKAGKYSLEITFRKLNQVTSLKEAKDKFSELYNRGFLVETFDIKKNII